jgi:hypothetical protein
LKNLISVSLCTEPVISNRELAIDELIANSQCQSPIPVRRDGARKKPPNGLAAGELKQSRMKMTLLVFATPQLRGGAVV